jgi:D-sedoheptulose 7-phosphate isomerase
MKFSIDNYISEHARVFQSLDSLAMQRCLDLITKTIAEGKKIITCGNGGSASTASHYITDWNKMYNLSSGNKFRGIALTDNIGLVTAFGNDIGYDDVFAGQIHALMDEDDLLENPWSYRL